MKEVSIALLDLMERGQRGALATVVRTRGSAPQSPGARMLLSNEGKTVGTVGGGAIERAIERDLNTCVLDGRPRLVTYDLGRDLGMCCGGTMEVFLEPVESSPRLILFGAGHVAKPTAKAALGVGFRVTVVDDREELNTEERFPECTRLSFEPDEAMDHLQLTGQDWVAILTHDHRIDELALDLCARQPHRYIGMIGSKRKVFRVLSRIHARRGLPELAKVYAPIGIDMGGVSPEEIAVSIVAELVALRHDRPANHMTCVRDPALQRVLGGELTPEAAATTLE